MTGIQALERAYPTQSMTPGNVEKTEDDLKQQIWEFIDYFNRTMAKPFNWKFAGFPEDN